MHMRVLLGATSRCTISMGEMMYDVEFSWIFSKYLKICNEFLYIQDSKGFIGMEKVYFGAKAEKVK